MSLRKKITTMLTSIIFLCFFWMSVASAATTVRINFPGTGVQTQSHLGMTVIPYTAGVAGQKIPLWAILHDGYEMGAWSTPNSADGYYTATNSTVTDFMIATNPANPTIQLRIDAEPIEYNVNLLAGKGGTATISSWPTFAVGTKSNAVGGTTTITAATLSGYKFIKWEVIQPSATFTTASADTDPIYIFQIDALPAASAIIRDINMNAVFKANEYPLILTYPTTISQPVTPVPAHVTIEDVLNIVMNVPAGYTLSWQSPQTPIPTAGISTASHPNGVVATISDPTLFGAIDGSGKFELEAVFTAIPYNVTATVETGSAGLGTITSTPSAPVFVNNTINVVATPNGTNKFVGWKASPSGAFSLTPAQQTNPNLTFTMPAFDVALEATFKEAYPITITYDADAGTAHASQSPIGIVGDGITIEAKPNHRYEFVGWKVVSNNVTLTGNREDSFFTMPNSAVHLEAIFSKIPPENYYTEFDSFGPGGQIASGETTPVAKTQSSNPNITYTVTDSDDRVRQRDSGASIYNNATMNNPNYYDHSNGNTGSGNQTNVDDFILTTNNDGKPHKVKIQKALIAVRPAVEEANKVNILTVKSNARGAKLPVRYILEDISVEVGASTYRGNDMHITVQNVKDGVAWKAYEAFGKDKHLVTPWRVGFDDKQATVRIELPELYKKNDIEVCKYVNGKYTPIKSNKYTITKIGKDYFVRLNNVTGGVYAIVKK